LVCKYTMLVWIIFLIWFHSYPCVCCLSDVDLYYFLRMARVMET
jgi:hypothetical protein